MKFHRSPHAMEVALARLRHELEVLRPCDPSTLHGTIRKYWPELGFEAHTAAWKHLIAEGSPEDWWYQTILGRRLILASPETVSQAITEIDGIIEAVRELEAGIHGRPAG